MSPEGGSEKAGAPGEVQIYDTTLRDGTQREGLSFSCSDKLRIAQRLDALGVSFIEGGWPGSNPKDGELFARARDLEWKRARLVAFGATRRAGVAVEDDAGLRALIEAGTEVVTLFGKSSPFHVRQILRTTLEENLRMVEESVRFLRAQRKRVIYDAEHFFDAYEEDAGYALETLRAAMHGGAEVLVLCDTNGGSLPWRVAEVVTDALSLGHPLGIHTHDDGGCAVANALAAIRAGARHVQGTINGYGERCGNANLCALIPTLELKLGMKCLPAGQLRHLYELSHFVAEVANLAPDEHMPYVGRSAFAHKGGVHVAAVRTSARAYQHVEPERVGNQMRVVVSELSGSATVAGKAEEYGVQLPREATKRVLSRIKQAEADGFSFEAAEASVALMLEREAAGYRRPFELLDYRVLVGQGEQSGTFAEATIKLRIGQRVQHTAAEGNGPVSALDAALRKALLPVFPELSRIQLVDYKVRILDGSRGTSAVTRVLIDSSDGVRRWSTVGAGPNIIAASWQALADSIEYGLRFTSAASDGAAVAPVNGTPPNSRPQEEVS